MTAQSATAVAQTLENDTATAKYVVITTKAFRARLEDGSERQIKVELGDHSVFPINYATGRAPVAADEIALSVLNAREMGKQVGDLLTMTIDGQEKQLTICGIYSDVTNGGKTAKADFDDPSADIMWSMVSADLVNQSLIETKTAEYTAKFAFAKVSAIDEFIAQTFGSTIHSIGLAATAAVIVALSITMLVILLFMRMLVVNDRYAIAVMKAFGFTNRDITTQHVARSVFVLMVGILLGAFLANTLGEALAGVVIAFFGASSVEFTVNPLTAYLLYPLLMLLAALLATIIGTVDAGRIKISENIKE